MCLSTLFVREHLAELAAVPDSVVRMVSAVSRYGAVGRPGAAESAAGVLIAAVIVGAWIGLGGAILRLSRFAAGAPALPGRSRALWLAWAGALGSGAWSLVWFGLGLAGLYRAGTGLAAVALGVALIPIGWERRADLDVAKIQAGARGASAPPRGAASPRRSWVAVLVLVPSALALVSALAPPTAKDALQYHLSLPKAFAAAGGLVDVPGNLASHFALGAEMHGLWALLIGSAVSPRAGEAAFGCALYAFFPLLLAGVYGWAADRGASGDWPWLAAAMVATAPTVVEVAGSGYVDLALALYVLLALQAVARWWRTADAGALALAALALGFALSVKLTACFAVLALVPIALARARGTPGGDERPGLAWAGLAALAAAVAVGCPWYLRTWARTGSPVFPFFATVWPGHAPGWDAERSALLHAFNASYGGADKGLLDYLWAPVRLALMGQREVAALYEGVLGVAFLVGAALVFWALARRALDADVAIAAAMAGAFTVWWLLSAPVLRYLIPALGPLAVAATGCGAALERRGAVGHSARWGLAACALAGLSVSLAWFVADDPLLAATGAEPRGAYLDRRLEYHPYYRLINGSLPADVRVWLVDVRRDTYHLDRPYVGDYLFEDYTLRQWIETATSGAEVRQRALAHGITHVLIRHDVLLDERLSPLVDDGLTREENAARLDRLRSFLTGDTRVVRADRRYALVELAPRVGGGGTGLVRGRP